MNVLSLFAGIGGFELGLERAGMTTVGQVEINPFCRKVLAKHWPDVPRHDDVRTAADWWLSEERPPIDLICGGFPCQDISSANTAGLREGLRGKQSGLWYAYRFCVKALRPTWVLVENSPSWQDWTGNVRSNLYRLGYATTTFAVSAGAMGAPHKRPRCIVVAHADSQSQSLRALNEEMARIPPIPRRGDFAFVPGSVGSGDGVPHRVDRLKALGNAVVPQVTEHIGRLIVAAETKDAA